MRDEGTPGDAGADVGRALVAILGAFSQAMLVLDADDRVIFTNAQYHRLFPQSPDPQTILGWGFADLLRHSIARGQVLAARDDPEGYLRQRLAGRGEAPDALIQGRWYRVLEEQVAGAGPLASAFGAGTVISYVDITDRHVAEEETRRKSALLTAAMEAIPGGFMVMDEAFNFIIWNQGWPAIGGATDADIRRHPTLESLAHWQAARGDFDHIRPDPTAFTAADIAATPVLARLLTRQAARPPSTPPDAEERALLAEWQLLRYRPQGRPDGEQAEGSGIVHVAGGERIVEYRRRRMPGLGLVSIYDDITQRFHQEAERARILAETARALADLRATQESLIRAEKLASLGGLVAGVSHELNTPVGITYTAATFLSDQIRDFRARLAAGEADPHGDLAAFLDRVDETAALLSTNAARAAQLVQSFKNVAADRTSGERRRFELRPYLEEILRSLAPQWKWQGHSLGISGGEGLSMDSYPGALSQIVGNLVVNAGHHAFAEGQLGHLRLDIRPCGETDGLPAVEIRFSDDGRGIAPDVLPRIFDPFFTTRRGGGSTGLGLNIVFNLVARVLGGRIDVDSAPGRGTRFVMVLPLSAPDPLSVSPQAGPEPL